MHKEQVGMDEEQKYMNREQVGMDKEQVDVDKEQVGIDKEQVDIGEGCEQVGMMKLREKLVGWFAYAMRDDVPD